MKFFEALKLEAKEVISIVGAGGKTTTMFAIGREAEQKGLRTILTTTTKIFYPQDFNLKVVVSDKPEELSVQIANVFAKHNMIVVGKSIELCTNSPDKLLGLDTDLLQVLMNSKADLIIIEADGSAQKSFKAPDIHEPVIPKASTLVMPIVGIDSIGSLLSRDYVHRPERVADIAEVNIGDKVTSEVVGAVFTSTLGFRKGIPLEARWVPFINKVKNSTDLIFARELARRIRQEVGAKVLIGAAQDEDPVKEVIGL